MPPAAAVVPPSGTPPSSSPKVASSGSRRLLRRNTTRDSRSRCDVEHSSREGATSLLHHRQSSRSRPRSEAVVVAGLSTSSTATRDDSTTVHTHPPSSSQQNTTPPPQRVCSRCACLSSCAWHKSKTTANASPCETCYRCEALNWSTKNATCAKRRKRRDSVQIENSRRTCANDATGSNWSRCNTRRASRARAKRRVYTGTKQVVAGVKQLYGKVRVNPRAIFLFFLIVLLSCPMCGIQSEMMR